MPFTCELSGQIVSGLKDEVVATPSGHICLKRLLLEKLSENGGIDPFGSEPENDRPLSSDELISLKLSEKDQVLTPRPSATSIPSMLQLFQSEYDALVLELFDTRKALEDARQELSQALYQNDAAVRVIARLSTERDSARQELQQWQASTQATPGDSSGGVATNGSSHEEPDAKRRKVDEPENAGIQRNRLPEHDLNLMLATWKSLSSNRKTVLKAAAASAPTPEIVAQYAKIGSQAWHKTTCKGVNCMAASGDLLVTGGKDKQVILYSVKEKVMKYSWQFGSVPEYVGISDSIIVACSKAGKVAVYSVGDGSAIDSLKISDAHIAGVKVHPTGEHVCFTSTEGKILVARFQDNKLTTIAGYTGESEEARYTCGDVHPDGLLFAAGTTSGHVHLWDFKNNALASILKVRTKSSEICHFGRSHILTLQNLA